jgi:hypothetical protein
MTELSETELEDRQLFDELKNSVESDQLQSYLQTVSDSEALDWFSNLKSQLQQAMRLAQIFCEKE